MMYTISLVEVVITNLGPSSSTSRPHPDFIYISEYNLDAICIDLSCLKVFDVFLSVP